MSTSTPQTATATDPTVASFRAAKPSSASRACTTPSASPPSPSEPRGIHMQIVTIPPGGRARAHKHATHETAIYALTGVSHVWHGPRLEHHAIVQPGDFFYIPADMPHLPYNPSPTESVTAVIARTDPNEQESVILLPELDDLHTF